MESSRLIEASLNSTRSTSQLQYYYNNVHVQYPTDMDIHVMMLKDVRNLLELHLVVR